MEEKINMKVNHGLLIISMMIISLIAVGSVSASENVSDVIETADFEETVAVDDNLEEIASIDDTSEDVIAPEENVEILSDNGTEPATPDVKEDSGAESVSSNNRYDWTILYGKNDTDHKFVTFDLSELSGKKLNNSYLILDSNTFKKGIADGESYLLLDLSSLLGKNNARDNSYMVLGLSSILGGNKTHDDSFLVLDLPGLGINRFGNSSLIIDLTNVLKQNGSSEGSYLSVKFDDNSTFDMDLSWAYNNGIFMGLNVTNILNGNYTELAAFLEDFSWERIFGDEDENLTSFLYSINWIELFDGNYTSLDDYDFTELFDGNLTALLKNHNVTTIMGANVSDIEALLNLNLTSYLNDMNWTALLKGNFTALMYSLNITELLGYDVSDIADLVALNFTSLMEKMNITSILGYDVSDIDSLLNNLTSLLDGWNMTKMLNFISGIDSLNLKDILAFNLRSWIDSMNLISLLDNINWTDIFGSNDNAADDGNEKSESNWWDSIFPKNDSSTSIIDSIIGWIAGNDKKTTNDQTTVKKATTVKIVKKATKITASKKTFKAKKSKKYSIVLKSGKNVLKNVKVTIKIGKKTYTAKTNSKGKATFNLKKLTKKGKYTAKIKFAGNKYYKPTTKNIKITVKK